MTSINRIFKLPLLTFLLATIAALAGVSAKCQTGATYEYDCSGKGKDAAMIQAKINSAKPYSTIYIVGNCILEPNPLYGYPEIDINTSHLTIVGKYKDTNRNNYPDATDNWGTVFSSPYDKGDGFFVKPGGSTNSTYDDGNIPVTDVTIKNIKFVGFKNVATGISSNGARISDVTFTNNYYIGDNISPNYGVFVWSNSMGTRVINNLFQDIDDGVEVLSQWYSAEPSGISIVGNTFKGKFTVAVVYVGNAPYPNCSLIASNPTCALIEGNSITNSAGNYGLFLGDTAYLTVQNNSISIGSGDPNRTNRAADIFVGGTDPYAASTSCESHDNQILNNSYTNAPASGVNVILDGPNDPKAWWDSPLGTWWSVSGWCTPSQTYVHNNQVLNTSLPALIIDWGSDNSVYPAKIN